MNRDYLCECVAILTGLLAMTIATDPEECSRGDVVKTPEYSRCITGHVTPLSFTDIFDHDKWTTFCKSSDKAYTCLSSIYGDCGETFIWSLLRNAVRGPIERYRPELMEEGCDGSRIKSVIKNYFDKSSVKQCVDSGLEGDMMSCLGPLLIELSDVTDWNHLQNDRQKSLLRFARSAFKCVLVSVLYNPNCPSDVYQAMMYGIYIMLPLEMRQHFSIEEISQPLTERDILYPIRTTVGIYGDSHMLVHNVTNLVTCSLGNDVTLLSNPLMKITTDMRYVGDHGASIIKQLTIDFLHSGRSLGIYRASDGAIPGHFFGLPDGSPIGHNKNRPVDITLLQPNTQVLINSTAKAFVVMVARSADSYLVTVRTGRGVLETASGLLVTGCSSLHGQTVNTELDKDEQMNKDCSELCANMTFAEFNLEDICNYDCVMGRNTKSAELGRDFVTSVRDVRAMDDTLSLDEIMPTAGPMTSTGSVCMTSYITLSILTLTGYIVL